MTGFQERKIDQIRLFHEATLSLCLGYAIIWAELATKGPLAPFFRLVHFVERLFPPYEENNPAAAFHASLLIAAGLAACLFVLLRLLSFNRSSSQLLRWIGGAVALMAMPATWFYVPQATGLWRFYNPVLVAGLGSLGIAAGFVMFLVLRGRWSVPTWGSVVLLIVYYGIWSWVLILEYDNHSFGLMRSMLAMLSGIAWILYLRAQGRAMAKGEARLAESATGS